MLPHLPSPRAGSLRTLSLPPDICRKQALQVELDLCKARLRAVEAQLLEVLEDKLRLKQEVEAWEVGGPPVGPGGRDGDTGRGSALNLLSCPPG